MRCHEISVDLGVNVRPVRTGELDRLRVLDQRLFGALAYEPFVLRQLFDMFRDYWFVAADPAGGLVGYSLGAPTPDRDGAWLLGLGVVPERRRRGIGSRLTMSSLELLLAKDVPVVNLTVAPSNDAAIALYKRIGFVFGELAPDYFGPGEDRQLMEFALEELSAVPAPRPIS